MKILMVCLGNICRSPLAHGVMEQLIHEYKLDWTVDSCGTNGYHDGESPDPRAIRVALNHGIDISHQISRRVTIDDFIQYDIILIMDQMNYATLTKMAPPYQKEKIQFLTEFAFPGKNLPVPDPYYDNKFEEAFDLIEKSCLAFVQKFGK
jgi:protein-tyrosine phosphatase